MSEHTTNTISRIALASVLLLYAVPTLHPLLMPLTGVTSHLLWWTHVGPVSLLAYFYGVKGGVGAIVVSSLFLIAGERFFGAGYGAPATWETVWSLAVALALTNFLVALFAVTAGRAARALGRAAYTSALTGLPNRQFMETIIAKDPASSTKRHTLIIVDLDDFDTINDSLGHEAGDRVLIALSIRFKECIESGQVLAHWGGDKFAVYSDSDSPKEIEDLVLRLQRAISLPLEIGNFCLRSLTAGFGIAHQEIGDNACNLARNADTALNRAKQHGSSGRCVFEKSMQEKAIQRLSILNDLSHAISHGELSNYYQPIYDTFSGEVAGLETLVRWTHPQKGMIPPDEFIPMAEHAGLIAQLGEVVLEHALRDFRSWREQESCKLSLYMAINISPVQLLEPGFINLLSSAAMRHQIPPELLLLEITETAMMQSEAVSLRVLRDLRQHGFRIAIDDFGSGYSSINYLHKLPVQILKIDRALIDQMTYSHQVPLVKPIVEIARALGLLVVAEGVETAEQAKQLADLGVDYLQGYYFAKPAPPAIVLQLLQSSVPGGSHSIVANARPSTTVSL